MEEGTRSTRDLSVYFYMYTEVMRVDASWIIVSPFHAELAESCVHGPVYITSDEKRQAFHSKIPSISHASSR